jgi:hypothetical protein
MQITDDGWRLVTSLEFALELKKAVMDYQADNDDGLGGPYAFTLMAWAVTGHDINEPPRNDDELTELAAFIMTHRPAIQAVEEACLKHLAKHDAQGSA